MTVPLSGRVRYIDRADLGFAHRTMTQSEFCSLLSYDPETGSIAWTAAHGRWGHIPAGTEAGTDDPRGYRAIVLNGKRYYCHRLAWFFFYGAWPSRQIDHINGDKRDNRIRNLRLATPTQNNANCGPRRNNTSGLKGVSWSKGAGKWSAGVHKNGKHIHLGYFDDPNAAHAAYCRAAHKHFGEFARHA